MAQVFTLTTLGSVGSGWWCRVYGHVYVPVAGGGGGAAHPCTGCWCVPTLGQHRCVVTPAQRSHGSRQLAATPSRRALLQYTRATRDTSSIVYRH